jgi:hypothetical protein
MNALKLCLSGTALSMLVGCASWDWESAAAYSASPQSQVYTANLIQQSSFDQQLRNQQNYQQSQAMLNQYYANIQAQQQLQQYNQLQGQLNTSSGRSITRTGRPPITGIDKLSHSADMVS